MPIVAMPDGTQVSFPDDMARDQIRSLILQKFPDAEKQASPKFGLGDTWPAQLAKSVYNAVTLPGDVYQGKAAVPQSENMVGGENTQNIDRVTNLAAIASPVSPGGTFTKMVPPATPTAQELKAAGTAVYSDPAIKDIQIPVSAARGLSAKIENDLVTNGSFRPATERPTFDVVREIAPKGPPAPDFWTRVQAEMNGEPLPQPPTVQSVSVGDLMKARGALGRYAKEMQPAANGAPTATSNAAAVTRAIGHIDDFLGGLTPDIATANANYSAGKALGNLDYRAMRADRAAAKTGSGSNIENTMRQQADRIPTRGLTPEEKALHDQIVLGDLPRNALRKVGKLGFGDGLSLMYHAALTLPTLGMNLPVGLAATGARKVGEALTRRQIAALGEMIAARAPLTQSLSPVRVPFSNQPLAGMGIRAPFMLGMTPEEQQNGL